MNESVARILGQVEPFVALEEAERLRVARLMRPVSLPAGEVLIRQGDPADCLYVLTTGRLEVLADSSSDPDRSVTVGHVDAPACIGEMGLLIDDARSATVRGVEDCELMRLARDDFERLTREAPELMALAVRVALGRLPKVEASRLPWFEDLDQQALARLEPHVSWSRLGRGEVLFEQGSESDQVFTVVTGRLEVRVDGQRVAEIGPGEPVGEMGVLLDEPRTATVCALRSSHFLAVDREGFEEILQHRPELTVRLMRMLAERVKSTSAKTPPRRMVRTLAVIALEPGEAFEDFVADFVGGLARLGDSTRIDPAAVEESFGSGWADMPPDDGRNRRLDAWFHDQEEAHRLVAFVSDGRLRNWTRRCLSQSDRVLLVVPANAQLDLQERLAALGLDGALAQDLRVELVLLHPAGSPQPSATARWLVPPIEAHHHVRQGNTQDQSRLLRRLTGKSIGVVLSGGGARGFAHVGALRALDELGVPVDAIGSVSIGACIAALVAMGLKVDEIHDTMYQEFVVKKPTSLYTLPFVSLLSGKRIDRGLEGFGGDAQIEDLWVPFFCLSCNLSKATTEVHRRGLLWRAVRASLALPGILPPVLRDGEVLVDGGVLNNLPVDVMRDFSDGFVIALDCSSGMALGADTSIEECPTGLQMLQRRLNPLAKDLEIPSIGAILVNTMLCASERQLQEALRLADLVVRYRLERYGLLQWQSIEAIEHEGYVQARSAFSDLRSRLRASGVPL